jgi:signal peptidase
MSARTRTRRIAGWSSQVLSWLVILVISGVLAICVVVPRIGGATPYTILTSSMQPTMPPGTLVVVRPVRADEVEIGDVVTFQLESGKAAVATHRVIAVTRDPEGEVWLHTQGDSNPAPDPVAVRQVQLKGELWYAVPELGRVNLLLDDAQRHLLVVLVASGLLAYAGFMLTGAARDRVRQRHATEAPEEVDA